MALRAISMSITVCFFASFRERIGRGRMEIEAEGLSTVRDVWQAVGEQTADMQVLAAINARHAEFDAEVKDGDEVAFFPPVTGG